jgi:hypothetical protein
VVRSSHSVVIAGDLVARSERFELPTLRFEV